MPNNDDSVLKNWMSAIGRLCGNGDSVVNHSVNIKKRGKENIGFSLQVYNVLCI